MSEALSSAAMTQEQLVVLKSSEWFAALEPAFQQAVLVSSRVRVIAAGKAVFHRGDSNDGIYCILSGAVRFGAVAPSGKESMVALIEAPSGSGKSRYSTTACAPMMPGRMSPPLCCTCRCVT
jgi:CRP/FNR family cyclic AMP-dependent transcriptional regulator